MSGFVFRFLSLLAVLGLSMCCLFGCRAKEEIGDLAIVLGAAIDQAENGNLQVTVELAHKDGINGEDESMVFSTEAKDWQDAEDKLAEQINKQLYFGHMVLLVFADELPFTEAEDFMEMFYKDQRLAPTLYVAWTSEDTQTLMQTPFGEAIYASRGIAERLAMELKNNRDLDFTLSKCMQNIYNKNQQGSLALLSIEDDKIQISQLVAAYEAE